MATLKDKEKVFQDQAFPSQELEEIDPLLQSSQAPLLQGSQATVRAATIKDKDITTALFSQSTRKAPGIDKLGLKALHLLWEWDSPQLLKLI